MESGMGMGGIPPLILLYKQVTLFFSCVISFAVRKCLKTQQKSFSCDDNLKYRFWEMAPRGLGRDAESICGGKQAPRAAQSRHSRQSVTTIITV